MLDVRLDVTVTRPEALDRTVFMRAIVAGVHRGTLSVAGRAKLNLTGRFLRVQTGRLRASIASVVTATQSGASGEVGTNVFYGRIHEFGARPHVIRPRRVTALRFTAGGRTVFATHVNHPGARERPWLRTALAESRSDIIAGLKAEIDKALHGR